MKMRKVISAFLAAICILTSFSVSVCTFGVFAEGMDTVYATTSASVMQGSYGYAYVYLDDLTDLAALTVSVYYDTEKITVKNTYNKVACELYDSSVKNGCVQFSYIFDGKGGNAKNNLFYFQYQVNSSAEAGNTYFDIVVSDAYTSSLKAVSISGSRCAFEITEKTTTKTCSISSSSTVSTAVEEEFTLSYRLSTYQIASGSFEIQYDSELFEFVELTQGEFLDGKIADVNSDLNGVVSVSFVGTAYKRKYDLVTVKFRTLKNVAETSDIKLTVKEFYDLDLNLITCNGYTTKATVIFDETYTEDSPNMTLGVSYNETTDKVTVTVNLEKNSHLGAGDFVLKFDTNYLTYSSAEKGFLPTFFNINYKNVTDGVLKFSIISLTDITDEPTVLTVSFDVKHSCEDQLVDFVITGSGLSDSLTNSILLNFVDASVIVPLKHVEAEAVVENKLDATCTADGSYDSVVYCSECTDELSREAKTIGKLGHNLTQHEAKTPTCTEIGWNAYETCSRCDYTTYVEIPMEEHNYSSTVVSPTTETDGYTLHTCAVCGDSYKDNFVDKMVDVNVIGSIQYTVSGQVVTVTHGKACSVGYMDGDSYVAINAVANGDGIYSFTAPEGVTKVLLVVIGDVDLDGNLDSDDTKALGAALQPGAAELSAAAKFAADVNKNGKLNSADLILIGRSILDTNNTLYKAFEW